MSDLEELYQEVILDHSRKPRNFGKLEGADRSLEGYNPLCGDQLTLYLKLQGDVVTDVAFEGSGCSISRASTSMMTQAIKGRTRTQVEVTFGRFHKMVTREPGAAVDAEDLGDLELLAGVAEFPARVKCATLAWHTLRAALKGEGSGVSTE